MAGLIWGNLLLVLLFFSTGLLSLEIAAVPGIATPLFPPAGIALGFLLLKGKRYLPGVFIGAMLMNFYSQQRLLDLELSSLVTSSGLIAIGCALQALLGFWLVCRFVGRNNPLNEDFTVLKFTALIGPVSSIVSPSVGICCLWFFQFIPLEATFDAWLNWWIGDALGTMLFAPLIYAIGVKNLSDWPRLRKWSVAIPTAILIVGCSIALFLNSKNNLERLQLEFNSRASAIGESLRQSVTVKKTVLEQLDRLIQIYPKLSKKDFDVFVSDIFKDSSAYEAITWMPKVIHKDRASFEKAASRMIGSHYLIREINSENQFVPAEKRDYYFPALYLHSKDHSGRMYGFDLNSQVDRSRAIHESIREEKDVTTPRLQLADEAPSTFGALIIHPVFDSSGVGGQSVEPIDRVLGLAVGVFKIQDFVQAPIHSELASGMHFIVWDNSSPNKDILYKSFMDRDALAYREPGQSLREVSVNSISHEEVIRVGSREWVIRLVPCLHTLAAQSFDATKFASCALLFLVVMLQGFLLVFTGRASRIEKLVDERTSELRESEARFRRMAEYTPVMIWTTKANMSCDYVNTTWLDFTGRPLEQELGFGWVDSVHPEDFNEAYEKFKWAHRKQKAFQHRYRLKRHDGQYRWVLAMGVPRFNQDEKFVGLIGSEVDVHDSVVHQEKMESLNSELMEFKYRISHDIVSPLTTARGLVNLAQEEIKEGDLSSIPKYFEYLKESLERQAHIIKNVLDLSRADSPDEVETEVVLKDVFQESFSSHCEELGESEIELKLELEVSKICTQATRFEQIVDNLISNAVKYKDDSKSRHYIRIRSRVDKMKNLVLDFMDNGVGFEPEYSESIFNMFTRKTSLKKGTGLGLYIVKKHLEKLGGMIVVLRSRDNTHFRLILNTKVIEEESDDPISAHG